MGRDGELPQTMVYNGIYTLIQSHGVGASLRPQTHTKQRQKHGHLLFLQSLQELTQLI